MSVNKVTYREFYIAVSNIEGISEEMANFAAKAIDALDHKNELRKDKPSKDKKEAEGRRYAVLALMSDGIKRNRDEVATSLEITQGQATSALTALVKGGALVKSTEKVDKAVKTFYALAEDKAEAEISAECEAESLGDNWA